MADNSLKIALLWHMHQPFYFDPLKGMFTMPWVRLHATKDYLDMLYLCKDYEKVKPTFNLTPSLLLQIEMYLEGIPEFHIQLTLKDPKDLTLQEKMLILKDFFMANWDTMIKPFPRYYELLLKRGKDTSEASLKEASRFFSNQDILDLQVYFNLVWIDPIFRNSDEFLNELIIKKSGFTNEDKVLLIKKHYEIMSKIFSEYSKAVKENSIEISTSPFFHPILPLLVDNYIAQQSDPSTTLPTQRYQYPQDAEKQIIDALNFVEKKIGVRPKGMWPSEGSISDEVLQLMAKNGITWTATDEEILLKTLKKEQKMISLLSAEQLYMRYLYYQNNLSLNIFFRDRRLSDDIGFVYSKMNPQDAVNHFIKSLYNIKNSLNNDKNPIVTVILDGENAWEFYENDGNDFLKLFYETIERNNDFEVITFSDYINKYDNKNYLSYIAPGSWINGNFKIWIGHHEDNEAWLYLAKTRDDLEKHINSLNQDEIEEVMKYIFIAEGSDWCWWYGDEHSTEFQLEFDELFRNNLKMVYKIIKKPYPPYLDTPIVSKEKVIKPDKDIMNFISPKIDGKVSSYFEWMGSYVFNLKKFGFTMHRATTYVEKLYLGMDLENIYFRLDPDVDFLKICEQSKISIEFVLPEKNAKIIGNVFNKNTNFVLEKDNKEVSKVVSAFDKIIEIALGRNLLDLKDGDRLDFFINIQPEMFLENIRFPNKGVITATIPPHNFEDYIWQA